MYKEFSTVNPLLGLLRSIPKEPIPLSKDRMSQISMFLASGGIYCENYADVVCVLNVLDELGVVRLKVKTNATYNLERIIDVE